MTMSASAVATPGEEKGRRRVAPWRLTGRLAFIAWRNLWRSPRRTWLTVGGIAFAIFLLVFSRSSQTGTFDVMIDNSARILPGHVQVQAPGYQDDPRVDKTFNATAARAYLAEDPRVVHVSARAQGFALLSSGERSFGAQVMGVEPAVELQWSGLAPMVTDGAFPRASGEMLLGETLARNLGLNVGDEIVALGTAREGGIAALAATVSGVFDATNPDFNRALALVPINDFREAWSLTRDEAHALVVIAPSVVASEGLARDAATALTGQQKLAVLDWQALMPEAEQMSSMKAVSAEIFFYVIAIVVGFSVVTTFMMIIYERTNEFGVLMASGMAPGLLHVQLQLEALCLGAAGILAALLVTGAILVPLADIGIPVPVPPEALEYYERFNFGTRLYPKFDWEAFWTGAWVLGLGTQFAALLPGLRLYRMRPVDAIRQAS